MSHVARSRCSNHLAYEDTGVITDFFFITTCDWELTNQLSGPIITGISGYCICRPTRDEGRTSLM